MSALAWIAIGAGAWVGGSVFLALALGPLLRRHGVRARDRDDRP